MKLFLIYMKNKTSTIIQLLSLCIVFFIVFWLYSVPLEPIVFGIELYGVCYILYLIYDFYIFTQKYRILEAQLKIEDIQGLSLPKVSNELEQLYCRLLEHLLLQKHKLYDKDKEFDKNLKDYYACWAHQIKTPISAVKLIIQSMQDCENADDIQKISAINREMFKIEFYADAVMNYLRLEDISSDYEFKNCEVEGVVKKAVKKFAPQFIGRHISLHIKDINAQVCTDPKWLGFIIEQLLSNAIKYNNDGGSVTIYVNDSKLFIEDTGIGINIEDIPRIMERGFTGYNGRMDKNSSGIGLYLCKKAADKLGFTISFDASYKGGARVIVDMTQTCVQHE